MKLFYDYDSTLNNLTEKWVEWINHTFEKDIKLADVDTWEWFYEMSKKHDLDVFKWFEDQVPYDTTKDFSTEPIDGAIEFVEESRSKTQHKITVLTATHCHSLIDMKDKHIEHFFGDVGITHTDNKHHYAYNYSKNIPNILLDDKPQSCVDWVENGGIAILFTKDKEYTYAQTNFEHERLFVLDNYEQVLELVDKVANNIEKVPVPKGKKLFDSNGLKEMEEGDIAYHSDYIDNTCTEKYTFIKLDGERFSVQCHEDSDEDRRHEYESVHAVMSEFVELGLHWGKEQPSPEKDNVVDQARKRNAKKREKAQEAKEKTSLQVKA